MTKLNNIATRSVVLNTLIKNYPYGIVYKDKNFKTVYANDLLCSFFDIPAPSVVIGTNCIYFLTKENQELVKKIEADLTINPTTKDFKLYERDGKRARIFHTVATPVIRNGAFEGVIYTVNDVTREENLNARLKSKHTQLKTFLENMPVLAYLKDINRNFVTGSKYAKDFVKSGRDVAHNISIDIDIIHKESYEDDQKVLSTDAPVISCREMHDLNGRKHWYNIHKIPLKDENSVTTGIITIANNIDAEKKLEAQRETFVASVGHDLKNPTIAQLRAIELLLSGSFGEIPDEQKEILEMIADSCKYMNAMLASLLATYRNERGIVRLSNNQISLVELVQECIEEMVYFAKDKEVVISMSKDYHTETICGDKVQMKRVIMNLLSNGIKYAEKSSILKVKVYNEDEFTCFLFENKSPYISPEKQETIFAQYVSFANAHKELGIGLGLYASKKIVEAHDGEIFVKSFTDNKNVFGFKIPYKEVEKERERVVIF